MAKGDALNRLSELAKSAEWHGNDKTVIDCTPIEFVTVAMCAISDYIGLLNIATQYGNLADECISELTRKGQ